MRTLTIAVALSLSACGKIPQAVPIPMPSPAASPGQVVVPTSMPSSGLRALSVCGDTLLTAQQPDGTFLTYIVDLSSKTVSPMADGAYTTGGQQNFWGGTTPTCTFVIADGVVMNVTNLVK